MPSPACPALYWQSSHDRIDSDEDSATPLILYQGVAIAFLTLLGLVIALTCLSKTICQKKVVRKFTKSNEFVPIWSRRKSSAHHVDTIMQSWDLERNPLGQQSDGRGSVLEQSSLRPSSTVSEQICFHTAVDSIKHLHIESESNTVKKEAEENVTCQTGWMAVLSIRGFRNEVLFRNILQNVPNLIECQRRDSREPTNSYELKQNSNQKHYESVGRTALYDSVVHEFEESL